MESRMVKVLKIVARRLGVPVAKLQEKHGQACEARQIAAYILRRHRYDYIAGIAGILGGVTHSTISYSTRVIANRMQAEARLYETVNAIEQAAGLPCTTGADAPWELSLYRWKRRT